MIYEDGPLPTGRTNEQGDLIGFHSFKALNDNLIKAFLSGSFLHHIRYFDSM